jgi:ATP:ADP antiporter, AAA family
MRDKLRTLPGIEFGEKSVSMLLTQSVFLGIFIGAFDITAHSLLLTVFDEKMMARGYVVSGIAGTILTLFYSSLQKRIQFKSLAIINLLFVSALTLSLWTALVISPAKWIIFLLFIMLGPLNILTLLGFWRTAGRIFPGRQEGKLFNNADTMLLLGIAFISLIIPLLLALSLQLRNLLLISAASVIIATVIQRFIGSSLNASVSDNGQQQEAGWEMSSLPDAFRKDSYLRTIVIFGALSVLTLFFVQYSFMAVTRLQYPVAENMAGFLGFFAGSMIILILLVKIFIFPYLLHNYGLKICLILSPALIALFTAAIILTGFIWGYTPETAGFMIFFILLAISRLISRSLREQTEFPVIKVILHSIKLRSRSLIHLGATTFLNEIGVVLSGIVLTCFGLLTSVKLIHFSLLLLFLSIIWMMLALKLIKEFRRTMAKTIETEGTDVNGLTRVSTLNSRFSAYINFRRDYFSLISGDFSVLNDISSKWYFEEIIDRASSKNDMNLLVVLKRTANNSSLDEGVRKQSAEVVETLQKKPASAETGDKNLCEAQKILSGTRMPHTSQILRLLRDKSPESKRLAIYMIGKFRLKDLISMVCECLNIRGLANDAYEVLRSFGQEIEEELTRYYLITSGNNRISRIILRLLGKTCSQETMEFLFSRLISNSRPLKEIAAKCLTGCKFTPSEEEKQKLHQLTSEVIGSISWYITAKICLERAGDNFLPDKIKSEIRRWNEFLFDILSITYGKGPVTIIKENLENRSEESIIFALEMINVVVSDTIKPKLVSLFDAGTDEDRLKKLFQFFPGVIPSRKKLLEDLLNSDYNLISLWTKACTLRSITLIDSDDMAESVTALLFSPEEMIREESAYLIRHLKPELYVSASSRISESVKVQLDRILKGTIDKRDLLFEKVLFLSKYFTGISEDELLSLATELRYVENTDAASLLSSEGCIVWAFNGDNSGSEVHVLYNGELRSKISKYDEGKNFSFYILSLFAIEEYHFQYPDNSIEILKYIDINERYSVRT